MANEKTVTKTVGRLEAHADWLANNGYMKEAETVKSWAKELDTVDARGQLDPTVIKRRRRK